MSLLPDNFFTVVLDKNLSASDCKAAYELIAESKGVLGLRFNEAAKQIDVKFDRRAEQELRSDIRNIDGVLGIRNAPHRL